MKRSFLVVFFIVLFAASAAKAETLKIGAIYPLTGPAATTGKELADAIKLAQEIINNKHDFNLPLAKDEGLPNLKGARIEVIVADHQGKPDVGLAEAERLITEENVVALIGCYYSSVTKTASLAAERHQKPFLNPESTAASLTERGFKWFFRTTPNDDTFSENFFQFLDELNKKMENKIKKVAIFHENTDFGEGVKDTETKYAKQYGFELAATISYSANSSSLDSEVQKIKNSGAEVVLPASYVSDSILFMKTIKKFNYAPSMILAMDAGFISGEFGKSLGADGDYILSREVWALDLANKKPMVAEINRLYKERFGKDMNGNSARTFTGLLTIADAINRAGSTEPEAIRKTLVGYSIPGDQLIMPWAGIQFNEKQQNELGRGIVVQLVDGAYSTVWPFDLASREIVHPFVPWDKR
ncbi:MAG: ABC transporter substrate-binding protein [Deltaproteobacteria bacterium]|nr:ABC transporter substrate-binding protein [Deltaproteobacteria bacterium]NIS78627.1 ABC transporter substrate-binding protein [Deltaproteobacteria bacterium]